MFTVNFTMVRACTQVALSGIRCPVDNVIYPRLTQQPSRDQTRVFRLAISLCAAIRSDMGGEEAF